MFKIAQNLFRLIIAIGTLLSAVTAADLKGTLDGFDDFMSAAMREFKVPGAAVAVVKDGKIILAKGYGYRDVARQLPMTGATLFPIASITKSFTVTALGTLVDQNRLDWDKPVREYLPGFRMYDPVATEQLTARDMVTHRSGLPRHDLIWYSSSLSREELVARLRYLEPNKPIREKFQYNNLMFVTAGYLGGRILGSSWEDLVRQSVLEPLGMMNSTFSSDDATEVAGLCSAVPQEQKDRGSERNRVLEVGRRGASRSDELFHRRHVEVPADAPLEGRLRRQAGAGQEQRGSDAVAADGFAGQPVVCRDRRIQLRHGPFHRDVPRPQARAAWW